MTKETGGSAFPVAGAQSEYGTQIIYPETGMTIRDWFAGKALHGIIAGGIGNLGQNACRVCAAAAYEFADAMLAERLK